LTAKKHHSILTLLLITMLCINLLNVQVVHADDGTPTEPPAPTQVETEPPTETSVEPTSTPVEITPTAETFEATPSPEVVADEDVPAAIAFPQALENTDIVVLDEQGQALVLGSQDTANALVSSDPVWCPESVSIPTPGANGCSASFASITELLVAMQADPQSFSQNGTIFLEQTDGPGFTTPLTLDDSSASLGTSFNSLNLYNLTVQGGWNPATGSTSDQTIFSGSNAYIQVGSLTNPWIGSVTLNNLTVLNVTSTSNAGLAVNSSGAVVLNNVTVVGSGAGQDAINISASNVALTDVNASYGDVNGISITASNPGTVTLNNVTANNNGHSDGSEPSGSGVYIQGADTLLTVTGGSFNNNARYGIEALNSTSTTLPIANFWTDQDDYSPGSVVTISGNDNNLNGENIGFTPGETVLVIVQGPNGYTTTCEGVADSYGAWACQITLWASNLAVGSYTYTATGMTSGISVTGAFTDARTIDSVTLNGGSSVTVAPNGSITVVVNVTTATPGNPNWGSTRWQIGSSSACINHSNHNSSGSYSETLTITAPATAGTYNITITVYQDDTCNQGASSTTITNGVTVQAPDTTPPVISPSVSGIPAMYL